MRPHHHLRDYRTKLSTRTASTFTFVAFLLSLHLEIPECLRAEVLKVVGLTGPLNVRKYPRYEVPLRSPEWPVPYSVNNGSERELIVETLRLHTPVHALFIHLGSIRQYITRCFSKPYQFENLHQDRKSVV